MGYSEITNKVNRFSRWASTIVKGRSLPIGTIRTHGGVKKRKTAQGWVPVKGDKKPKKGPSEKQLQSMAAGFEKRSVEHQDQMSHLDVDLRNKLDRFKWNEIDSGAIEALDDLIDEHNEWVWYYRQSSEYYSPQVSKEDYKEEYGTSKKPTRPTGSEPNPNQEYRVGKNREGKATLEAIKKKSRALPVGSIRTHGGVKKQKTARGWVPVKEGGKKAKKRKKPKKAIHINPEAPVAAVNKLPIGTRARFGSVQGGAGLRVWTKVGKNTWRNTDGVKKRSSSLVYEPDAASKKDWEESLKEWKESLAKRKK